MEAGGVSRLRVWQGDGKDIGFWPRALSLTGLCTLALAQPLLGDLSVGFLISQRAQPLDIVLVCVTVVVLPPVLLLALEQLVKRLRPSAAKPLHSLLIGVLAGAAVQQAFVLSLGFGPRAVIWLGVGGLVTLLYGRLSLLRTFASALSVAAAITLVSYLVLGPTGKLVFPTSVPLTEGAASGADAPIVLIIFDELPGTTIMGPDKRIARRMFPNFARLARNATWYPNASTVHNMTDHALPALFTGRVSEEGSQPADWDHAQSLFTLLGDRYDMHVSEPYTQVCPRSLCDAEADRGADRIKVIFNTVAFIAASRLLPSQVKRRIPRPPQWRDLDIPAQVARFGRNVTAGQRPGLYMLHVVAPHRPWRYLPNGQQYPREAEHSAGFRLVGRDRAGERTVKEEWPVVQQYQRHVIQTQYADHLLGQLVHRLKSEGLWDKSVVVATSDHGQTIRPDQTLRRRVTPANVQDVMTVPLLIKAPYQRRPRTSRGFAQTIDVMPTIARLVGARIPWKVDGRSLTEPGPDRAKLTLHKVPTGSITVDAQEFRKRSLQDVAPRSYLLAAQRRGLTAFEMGPRPVLLGRRISPALPERRSASVTLETPQRIPALDPNLDEIPVRLVGKVRGIPPGEVMAVAVGGTIVATSRTYRSHDDPGTSLTAMLSPRRVRNGGPVVLLWVGGAPSTPQLERVRLGD